MYVPTTPIIKLSVIFFYRRIFVVRKFKMITTILATVLACYYVISFLLVMFFQCKPLRKAWDPATHGYCAAPRTRILAWQGINTGFDFTILLLPLPMLWRLNRPWQDRLELSGVFMVGAFVCGASVYRIVTLVKINNEDISCKWSIPRGRRERVDDTVGLQFMPNVIIKSCLFCMMQLSDFLSRFYLWCCCLDIGRTMYRSSV